MTKGILPKNYQRTEEKKRWAEEDRQKAEKVRMEKEGQKTIDRVKNGVEILENVTKPIKKRR